jgi:hypothetical protein
MPEAERKGRVPEEGQGAYNMPASIQSLPTCIIQCTMKLITQNTTPLHLLIQDLDLDRALLRIRRHVERLHRPLQREPMRHQRLQVDQATTDETQRLGVLVAVPVLELQVDLVGGEVHERVGLFGFADADDEDFAAEADRLQETASIS